MQSPSKIASLARRLDLFRGLGPKDVAHIFDKGLTMRLRMGEVVLQKGTRGGLMYVIIDGRVEVRDDDRVLATLETGAMFGEMGLVSREPRSATVVAVEPTIVFALGEDAFQELLSQRVAVRILLNIIKTLSFRLRDANTRLAERAE